MTDASKAKMLARVEHEVHEQRFWRAKEILRGSLSHGGYDPELFEEYGRLLLQLGEEMEAGKYLLLAAPQNEDYRRAINLFVGRHTRSGDPLKIYHALPASTRLASRNEYPPAVAAELQRAGCPEQLSAPKRRTSIAASKFAAPLLNLGCAAFVSIAAVLLVIGAVTVVVWLLD